MLILLVLAAFCFDLSLAFQRKRQLVELADAAANDAVTAGLDLARLRADGRYCLDRTSVGRAVQATLAASSVGGPEVAVVAVRLADGDEGCATGVVVTLAATSEGAFGRAVPGMPAGTRLEASSSATAVVR